MRINVANLHNRCGNNKFLQLNDFFVSIIVMRLKKERKYYILLCNEFHMRIKWRVESLDSLTGENPTHIYY